MKDGYWHVVRQDGHYGCVWTAAEAGAGVGICRPQDYLYGAFAHFPHAEMLATDANLLVGDDPNGEKAAALRRIVDGVQR